MKVTDFLPEAVEALTKQLEEDQERWGDTWLERPRDGQEVRVWARYDEYFLDWYDKGEPVPWMKVIGNALIAWIRETHPEASENWSD